MLTDIPARLLAEISDALHSIFMMSHSRHFWFYMLCYLLIAFFVYTASAERNKNTSFWRFLFPSNIYTHPSALMDLKIWLVVVIVVYSGVFALMFGLIHSVTVVLNNVLDLFWEPSVSSEAPDFFDRVIYTLVYTCCIDFGFFLMHMCQHKISWLWSFHKVHHSASVLTPFTANRHHPVDYLMHAFCAFFMGALATVLFSRYHGTSVDAVTLFNTSAIHFFYYMTANVRHSHIWLSFGPLNKLFVSPAMHQIHHSIAPEHYDRNFGFVFSIWDGLFRTRYLPVAQESVVVGLNASEKGYSSFLDAMVRPFAECFEQMRSLQSWRRRRPIP